MTSNKRGSGRADPSDEPLIKRLRNHAAERKQDADHAPAKVANVEPSASGDNAAEVDKEVEIEDKPSSDTALEDAIAQRKAEDEAEAAAMVDYSPSERCFDGQEEEEEEKSDAPPRPRSELRHMDLRSYREASNKKYSDQRVAPATPAEGEKATTAPNEQAAASADESYDSEKEEEGEVSESSPSPKPKSSPVKVEIHNGEPDSDVEIVEPPTAGSLPRMWGPDTWPMEATRATLLAKAVVTPDEYYRCFSEWKRQAKSVMGGSRVHPIPVVLSVGETPEEYERAVRASIKLSANVTVERSQRLNFAENRARRHFGGVPPRAQRYAAATASAASTTAGNQQSGPARPLVASSQAPMSLGRADTHATAPSTRGNDYGAGDGQRSPRQDSANRRRYPSTQQGQHGGRPSRSSLPGFQQHSDSRIADLTLRVGVIEASDASLLSRVNSVESSVRTLQSELHTLRSDLRREVRTLRELGKQTWASMKARLAAFEHGAQKRRRRPRPRSPTHSPPFEEGSSSPDSW